MKGDSIRRYRRGRDRGKVMGSCLWARSRGGGLRLLFLGRGRRIFHPGEEDRDLRLDEGVAILFVADLGVEGLHAGAKVGSHYEVDVLDRWSLHRLYITHRSFAAHGGGTLLAYFRASLYHL